MRPQVKQLIALGIMPSEAAADASVVEKYQNILRSLSAPLTDEEACALTNIFGDDDCFGLSWTLVHLIESSPSWPIAACLTRSDNEWIELLRSRVSP